MSEKTAELRATYALITKKCTWCHGALGGHPEHSYFVSFSTSHPEYDMAVTPGLMCKPCAERYFHAWQEAKESRR